MKFQHKIILVLALVLTFSNSLTAQEELNNYKYIIVPEQFSCQKNPNDYRLNELTQFLLEKQNFKAYLASENLPEEANNNNCLSLYVDVTENNNLFKTKLTVNFKNCKNQVVFSSGEGESREKQFKAAYNIALRNAFKTFNSFKHDYNKIEESIPQKVTTDNKTKAEVIVDAGPKEVEKVKEEIKTDTKEVETPAKSQTEPTQNILYAQKISNGFQLVDSQPKVVYKIKNTNLNHVFLVEGKVAIIYKLDANWIIEYYQGDTLQKQLLNIKF
ncbi:hypothetical protein [Olleya aquimaris]|uniref:Secreted protein n=1 Tax=Olleya aquimaris TaxID=639310 RepID=A0A327RE16_9FLAO|nr:hypothetical protein [Olleya aquimaris]RAJ14458.1 hypothetical protein LY08_01633 [Olleya aquimaris]